jgi:hypothetical protein
MMILLVRNVIVKWRPDSLCKIAVDGAIRNAPPRWWLAVAYQ